MKKRFLSPVLALALLSIPSVCFASYVAGGEPLVSQAQPQEAGKLEIESLSEEAPYITFASDSLRSELSALDQVLTSYQIDLPFRVHHLSLRMGQDYYLHNVEGTDYTLRFELAFRDKIPLPLSSFQASITTDDENVTPKRITAWTTEIDGNVFRADFPYRTEELSDSLHAFLNFFDKIPNSVQNYDCVFHFEMQGLDVSLIEGFLNPTLKVTLVHAGGALR